MKVNLKKIGAVLVGATILASSVGFAALTYGNTELVNANGQPVAKVVVGENAAASDGVAAANIAAKIANNAYAKKTLQAQASGGDSAQCEVTDKSVTLKVTMPGLSSTQQAVFGMLIAEDTDNDLADRDMVGDYYNELNDFSASDANPFQDQVGGVLTSVGVAKANYSAFLVDSSNFAPFADYTTTSSKFGTTATEYQRFYVEGASQFDGTDSVVFYDNRDNDISAVYQVWFGPGDNGLHFCPGSTGDDLGTCSQTDSLGAARYQIMFLGEPWIISGIDHNGGANTILTTLNNDEEVGLAAPGDLTVKLAKEAAYGYTNVGECLESGDVKVCLDDISEATGLSNIHPAIVSVYKGDSTTPVAKDQIDPGTSKEISVGGGDKVTVHVYQTAPGYTFGSSWAEMAIYENEIKLESGKRFLDYQGLTPNSDWWVEIGVSKDDAGTTSSNDLDDASHLRHITLWTDSNAFDAVNSDGLYEGESLPVVDLDGYQAFMFENMGLESFDPDTFRVEFKDASKDFKNVMDPGGGFAANITATGAYVKVTSQQQDAFKSSLGKKGSELYFVWEDNDGDGIANTTANGDYYYVILKDKNGDYWGIANGTAPVDFDYRYAGSDYGRVRFDPNAAADDAAYAVVQMREDAGDINSTNGWDTVETVANFSSGAKKLHAWTGTTADDDKVYSEYGSANIVAGQDYLKPLGYDNQNLEDESFITLRGSVVNSVSSTQVKVQVSDKVRKLQTVFKPTGTSLEPNSQVVGPLREGESATVGDVTIEVQSIDVQTSTTTGGSASATIVDASSGADLGQQVDAATPYNVGKLVYLDSEIGDETGALITVGGNAVNKVSAAAMQEAGLSLSPDNPVLVETVGNKIVVAGYTASDTLAAADQFIQALQVS